MPDKIGTVRCNSATCLQPGSEYLLWGKLPKSTHVSPGSAVMTEPKSARSAPKGLMVARVVTPLWADGWVPLKVMNVSEKPLFLRRNAKLADLVPCVALEDLDLVSCHQNTSTVPATPVCPDARCAGEKLESIGLSELDISLCDASSECKDKLSELIVRYQDVFSRNHLDCGKAEEFVHRIHLIDQKPFRLPFRRVPPSQYQKLRQVLSEMEEKEIIRKSTIDILFGNILTDPDVTDFGRYVTKLSEDLKEAMLIAQEHVTKEQNRQARLYNRKAKGPTIEIGDRVLVANKKERGKRKVADRWESIVYTVTEMNPQTHTYKIQDTVTGRERIVHRNLLMMVNFLPIQDVPQSSQSGLSMSSVQSSVSVHSMASGQATSEHTQTQVSVQQDETQCGVDDVHSLVSVPEPENYSDILPASEERTREWVSHLNTPSQQSPEGGAREPSADFTDDVLTDKVPDSQSEHSHASHTNDTVDRDDTSTVSGHHTVLSAVTSDSVSDAAHTVAPTELPESAPQRTTRLGRVVRPVNRLLYTIARQDVTRRQQQNVQTVCSSVV
ncbi:hypothetical protein SKAU_G00209540 [Synaphobranchus kaupii]|uniref:Uncharacterized protein n=1 Tax=Synaphobranchus kaupii TaxID=118154 RepID=A0A9Q1ITW8_SYNKA|nr:hypothetical protein SKAU_G00209540 [Synaphobranchus kaupii]